jgi:hypothetical protein
LYYIKLLKHKNMKKFLSGFLLFVILGGAFYTLLPVGNSIAANAQWCSSLSDDAKKGGLVPCGRACDDPTTSADETKACELCDIFVMLERIINFLLFTIVPILAVLMIAIGGIMYVISGTNMAGGAGLVSKAKSLFMGVIIGLFITYGAWVIVSMILSSIGVADWTGLQNGWWKINCR